MCVGRFYMGRLETRGSYLSNCWHKKDMDEALIYQIVGTRRTWTPNSYTGHADVEEETGVVATFDTKQMANEYVEKSKLKQPHTSRKFRRKSLLWYWDDVEVELVSEEEHSPPPHNPEFG